MGQTAQKPGQEVATKQQRYETVQDLLTRNKGALKMALPKILSPDRLIRVALTEISKNPRLLECDPGSLYAAVLQCGQLGLEPTLGRAYLIPRWNGKRQCLEVNFQPGYLGHLDLVRRSDEIDWADAQIVREGDAFDYEYGSNPFLKHKPAQETAGKATHYYAIVRLKTGSVQFKVWTPAKAMAHRDKYSEAYKKNPGNAENPWNKEFDQMALKSVIIDLCKLLPKSVELARALDIDHQVESDLPTFDLDVQASPALEAPVSTNGSDLDKAKEELAEETAQKTPPKRGRSKKQEPEPEPQPDAEPDPAPTHGEGDWATWCQDKQRKKETALVLGEVLKANGMSKLEHLMLDDRPKFMNDVERICKERGI